MTLLAHHRRAERGPHSRRPEFRDAIPPEGDTPGHVVFAAEEGATDPTPLLVPATAVSWHRARALHRELGITLRHRPGRAGCVELLAVWEHPDGTAMHHVPSAPDAACLRAAASTLLWQVWRASCKRGEHLRGEWSSGA